jgi:hypothetical protein
MPSVPEFTATGLYGSVELIIRNQQFNSAEGSFMYNVRLKDHNETDDWVVVFNGNIGFPSQSNSNYTIISIPVSNGAQIDVQVNAMIGAVGRVFNPNATSIIEMYPYVFVGATSGWSNTKTVTIPLTPPSLTPVPSSSTSTQTPTLNGAPSPYPPVFTATGLYGSVELTIINQQFNSSEGSLYYNVQLKDHNETDDWVVIFDADNSYPAQSNSNYTIISIPAPLGAQIDVQVNAMIGTVVQLFYPNATSKIEMYPYAFGGSTSGWSDTQTVTISQSPTPTPSSSTSTSVSSSLNLSFLITAIAVIALLLAITIFLLYIRKSCL